MPAGASGTDDSGRFVTERDRGGLNVYASQGPFPSGPHPRPGRVRSSRPAGVARSSTQRFPATVEQLAVVVKKLGDTKLSSPQLSQTAGHDGVGRNLHCRHRRRGLRGTADRADARQPAASQPRAAMDCAWRSPARSSSSGVWLAAGPDDADGARGRAQAAHRAAREAVRRSGAARERPPERQGRRGALRVSARSRSLAALEHIYGALDSDDSGPEPADRPGLAA